MNKVPFLDLRVSNEKERGDLLAAIEAVLRHGRLILGPEVDELETKVALYCGRKYAIGVNSGTDALFLALKSLNIGPGDEVITTSLSWVATANAIALTGATPVFADILDDLTLDPESVQCLITARTKAIIPVHYTGKICRMTHLQRIATHSGIYLIEDAAQAFGASFDNKPAGSFGTLACFSMNAMKVFAACGEAGMIVTDDENIRNRLIALRYNGMVDREICVEPSLNGRLDTIQAAILLKRLNGVKEVITRRRAIAAAYNEKLAAVVKTPVELHGQYDACYTYTVQVERRDELMRFLSQNGIETKIQHPILMPQQPAYENAPRGNISNASRLVERILCIPAHERLSGEEIEYVASAIIRFYSKNCR